MRQIEHVVVLFLENRSFDNLLGWLYTDQNNQPAHNIPPQPTPVYEGLESGKYFNTRGDGSGARVEAARATTGWPPINNPFMVPTPEPGEQFENITRQIFGAAEPAPGQAANMSGFLADYATLADPAIAAQIMQCYSPEQVPVISHLARNFAVCDHWFASAPCQTWPNRSFVHCGSSDGYINNDIYEPYGIDTIFNVLQEQGISWGVFSDTIYTPALTRIQFDHLWRFEGNFKSFEQFQALCRAPANAEPEAKLPAYSFIEPRFATEWTPQKTYYGNDFHCTNNIAFGEYFLAQVYQTVRSSLYRDKILLIITFDEHGGCYDHVPPPTGAIAPQPSPISRDKRFHFDRFGVRVPAIVVSSYVKPGTVFRAEAGQPPYDHTSILATLREWKQLDADPEHPFLPSPRIAAAPTVWPVLTLDEASRRRDWPEVNANSLVDTDDMLDAHPINDLQMSLLAGEQAMRSGRSHIGAAGVTKLRTAVHTHADLRTHRSRFAHPERPFTPNGLQKLWFWLRRTITHKFALMFHWV
ncbi:MAG: phosphoesterase [Caldilineaceae bacterium]|nr:phosphoesterase [Caldilineaceae bacterium]